MALETRRRLVECNPGAKHYSSARMMCPACNNEVDDTAAVCPHCDNVLDASLYDAAPPDEDAPPRPAPKRVAPKTGARPGVKRPATRPGAPAVKKKPAARRPPVEDDAPPPKKKDDWRSQLSEDDWKEYASKEPEKFVADKTMDANDAMLQTRRYLLELSMADKLALFGTSVLLLATFLPWRETVAEGDVLGVFSSGVIVTVLSALALGGIIVRTRKTMPDLNPLLPWMAQLGCVGASGVWCLIYMMLSWDPTLARSPIGNYEVWVSKPAFGLILALLAGITSIVGTIFGLKEVGRA